MDQCEDLDLWIRLLLEGVPFYYVNMPMAFYRETMGMSMSNPQGQVLGHLRIISKLKELMRNNRMLNKYEGQISSASEYWSSQLTQNYAYE